MKTPIAHKAGGRREGNPKQDLPGVDDERYKRISENLDRLAAESQSVVLADEDARKMATAARILRSFSIDAGEYFLEVAGAELKLRSSLDPAGILDSNQDRLAAFLTWDAWELQEDLVREHLLKLTGSPDSARLLRHKSADLFLSPSVQKFVRTLRAQRFAGADRVKTLDRICDVLALRLLDRTGAPVRSWGKRLTAMANLQGLSSAQHLFKAKLQRLGPGRKTRSEISQVIRWSESNSLVEQLFQYLATRHQRGAFSPKQRASLWFLALHRAWNDTKKPVVDADLVEIEALIATWKSASRRQLRFGKKLSAELGP